MKIEVVSKPKKSHTLYDIPIGTVFSFSTYLLYGVNISGTFLMMADERILNLETMFHYDVEFFYKEAFDLYHLSKEETENSFEYALSHTDLIIHNAKIVIETDY